MKVVVQRVKRACVRIDGKVVAEITLGLCLLVGIRKSDNENDLITIAQKIVNLRIFPDAKNKMNRSLREVKGSLLVVPQFTLYAELTGQNRPYFGNAAPSQIANTLFNQFISELKLAGVPVVTGEFGAYMQIELINDGPVTIILDSEEI